MSIEKYSEYIARQQQILRDNGLANESFTSKVSNIGSKVSNIGSEVVSAVKKHPMSFVRGAVDTATLGGGKYVKAAADYVGKKALGYDTSWQKEVEQEKEKEKKSYETSPAAYTAGGYATIGLTAAGIASSALRTGVNIVKTPGVWNKVKTAVKGGAEFGKGLAKGIATAVGGDTAASQASKVVNKLKPPMEPMVPGQQNRNRLKVD